MNTTALIRPSATPDRAAPRSDAGSDASPFASEEPTFGEALAELIPLIGAVAGQGPPVIFLAGPWLLLVLMLSGAFASLLVLVVFMVVVAMVLVALIAATLAGPYLLVRFLRRHRGRHALSNGRSAQLLPVASRRAAA
jgi:hypothetical protein